MKKKTLEELNEIVDSWDISRQDVSLRNVLKSARAFLTLHDNVLSEQDNKDALIVVDSMEAALDEMKEMGEI